MSAPDDEKRWASDSDASTPKDEGRTELTTDEPLARAISQREEEDLRNADVEPAEETDSQDDFDKEKSRLQMRRTQSNWTTATETSIATTEPPQAQEIVARKRTWGQKLNPLKRKYPPPVPEVRTPSREQSANFFSRLTFQWISPLMSVGYQRPLEVNDVWSVNPKRGVDSMSELLVSSLKKRKDAKSNRPLTMALYDTFKREFIIGGACQLTASLCQVMSPFAMKYLIRFAAKAYIAQVRDLPAPHISHGIGLVVGITCMQVIQSLSTNHFIYRGMMVGGEARAVLIALIFDKAMKISGRARAGGKPKDAEQDELKAPDGVKPGSKEERSWFKKKLGKDKSKGKKTAAADGQGWSNGRIVNLMSTDTYRIDAASGMFHICWTSPIQVVVALALLLINLTYSALAGFAFICIMMPLLGKAISSLMRRRKVINKITDQRVTLTQEILSSVRFIKYFGWEMSFLERIEKIRNSEISKISFLLSIRNGIMAVSMTTPIFASMLSFITYSLTHPGMLNPAPVFSSLALFNSLRIPLNLLPMVIGQVVDGIASISRIEEFLDEEEVHDEATWDLQASDAIVIKDADFTWERTTTQETDKKPDNALKSMKEIQKEEKAAKSKRKEDQKRKSQQLSNEKLDSPPSSPISTNSSSEDDEETPFQIKNIDLKVKRNELIAVIGSVGSGKSSLLGALAGDMRRTAGNVTFGSTRAFCPQYAWIQNATVKQNIVFGREYDRKWYNKVVDACALRPDLEMLPSGDLTEIGERGITVSGGQKQRLNIARAIYFDADIILMDDPLSAVDAHVGRHIMEEAICGLLKDKARVLATHQLHVLHRADRIVWMKEGMIHKVATFPELMAQDEDFQRLMATTSQADDKEESGEGSPVDEVEEEKKKMMKKKNRKPANALMQQEDRAVSSVGWEVYAAFIRAAGSILVAPMILGVLLISQAANIITSLWLSWWTSDQWGYPTAVYIGVYAALGVVQAALMFAFSVTLTVLGTKASKVMLNRAITRVLRSPMSFFDTTPLGRITNRFAKDVDVMDNMLTDSMRMFFFTMAMILSVFCLIIAYYYYFAVALVPLTVMFIFAANYYRSSAREMKRHEAVLRSVVFSRFGEAVTGISTIRAYGLQKDFSVSVNDAIDSMDGAYFLTYANQRWLAVRLDAVGTLLVFTVGILVVTSRFSVNPSIGGLVLSYILTIVQMIQFTVRQLAEVENNMNSTERIHYYGTKLDEEAPLHMGDVPKEWPQKGEIVFDDVQMRYRAGLPLVLQGLSMHVKAGERIGVVGRTGAGKSSIMSTLFRLVELSGGSITIDGINIATIGLHDLRSRLAIIPQDPTLFRGTIRSNLDPFNEHNDLELWNALRQADLVGTEQTIEDESGRIHLDTQVEDEGLNFSLGQRQLLALARALVRGSQIIVCDEATSSVDFETDQKIQRTIVKGFRGKTLLCIAHRLKTIIGYVVYLHSN